MRIEPVAGTSSLSYPVPAPSRTTTTATPQPEPAVDRLAFRPALRATGVTVMRIIDTVTGDTVVQLPPEQVLRMVEDVVRRIREQEAHDGDR